MQKLSLKGFSFASAILWCLAVMLVGAINLFQPSYGKSFLDGVASIYPWTGNIGGISSVIAMSGCALVDGAVGGFIFAWIYNRFVK